LVQKSDAISAKRTNSFFGRSLALILTDGSVHPQEGKILLADRQVDSSTGTIRIVAAFQSGNVLRPASMDGACRNQREKRSSVVPQSAVAQSQGSYQVAVIAAITKLVCVREARTTVGRCGD